MSGNTGSGMTKTSRDKTETIGERISSHMVMRLPTVSRAGPNGFDSHIDRQRHTMLVLSNIERAARLRTIARRLPTRCYDVAINLVWDAEDLEDDIWPGSEESWRATDRPIMGG